MKYNRAILAAALLAFVALLANPAAAVEGIHTTAAAADLLPPIPPISPCWPLPAELCVY